MHLNMFLAVGFSETKLSVWSHSYFLLLGLLKAVSDPERTLLKMDGATFPACSNKDTKRQILRIHNNTNYIQHLTHLNFIYLNTKCSIYVKYTCLN